MSEANEMIKKLKEESSNNPAAGSVFHLFAMRSRARGIITLRSLFLRMKIEGFSYTKEDYATVLTLLAKHGVGKLDLDAKGRVRSLKEIKISLPSLGKALVGQGKDLSKFRAKSHFAQIPPTKPIETKESFVELRVKGIPVRLRAATTPEEVSSLMEVLQKLMS